MGLDERLRRLRGHVGAVGSGAERNAPDQLPTGPALAERLGRVRTGRGGSGRSPDERQLADALGAEPIAPGVLILERLLPVRLRHGRVLLGMGAEPRYLPLPFGCGREADAGAPWVCLDTETSGLAGGTGTWAFVTGLLHQGSSGWRLRQFLLTRLDAEPAYLEALAADLARPARLLTYNGRAFDAPLLATRFRLAGRPDAMTGLPHLDLLAPVRRAFGPVWPDCRLATAESRLLGVNRSDDLPGAAAPQAWLGWLRRGETAPLSGVLRHNRLDLLSLAALLPALDAVYSEPGAAGADLRAVAAAHLAGGRPDRALSILAAGIRDLGPEGLLDLARLYRRSGDWPRARAIWERLDDSGAPEARAALARYHEHRSRDLDRALSLTEALPTSRDRERRRFRLLTKLDRAAKNPCLDGL